jgi:hypothetical protein
MGSKPIVGWATKKGSGVGNLRLIGFEAIGVRAELQGQLGDEILESVFITTVGFGFLDVGGLRLWGVGY